MGHDDGAEAHDRVSSDVGVGSKSVLCNEGVGSGGCG